MYYYWIKERGSRAKKGSRSPSQASQYTSYDWKDIKLEAVLSQMYSVLYVPLSAAVHVSP